MAKYKPECVQPEWVQQEALWVLSTPYEGMIENYCPIADWPPLGNQLQPCLKIIILMMQHAHQSHH